MDWLRKLPEFWAYSEYRLTVTRHSVYVHYAMLFGLPQEWLFKLLIFSVNSNTVTFLICNLSHQRDVFTRRTAIWLEVFCISLQVWFMKISRQRTSFSEIIKHIHLALTTIPQSLRSSYPLIHDEYLHDFMDCCR